MNLRRHVGTVIAGAVVSAATVLGVQAPALAAWPSDIFHIADFPPYPAELTDGNVSWGNRTAVVAGTVFDLNNLPITVTAIFEAYAGSNKIDSQTRTANEDSSLGSSRGYSFSIGDPNLAGGIDRIKITLRLNYPDGSWTQGQTYQVHRDGVGEIVGNM